MLGVQLDPKPQQGLDLELLQQLGVMSTVFVFADRHAESPPSVISIVTSLDRPGESTSVHAEESQGLHEENLMSISKDETMGSSFFLEFQRGLVSELIDEILSYELYH